MAEALYTAVLARAREQGDYSLGTMVENFRKFRPLHFPAGPAERGAVEAYRRILRDFSGYLQTPSPQSPPESPRFGFRSPESVAKARLASEVSPFPSSSSLTDSSAESSDHLDDGGISRDRLVADAFRLRRLLQTSVRHWKRHVRRVHEVALKIARGERLLQQSVQCEVLNAWTAQVAEQHRRSAHAENLRFRIQLRRTKPRILQWRIFTQVNRSRQRRVTRATFSHWHSEITHLKERHELLLRRVTQTWRKQALLAKTSAVVAASEISSVVQLRRGLSVLLRHVEKQQWIKSRNTLRKAAVAVKSFQGFAAAVNERVFVEHVEKIISKARHRSWLRQWRRALLQEGKLRSSLMRFRATHLCRLLRGWKSEASRFRGRSASNERVLTLRGARLVLRRLQAPIIAARKVRLAFLQRQSECFGLWKVLTAMHNEKRRNFRESDAACLALHAVDRMIENSVEKKMLRQKSELKEYQEVCRAKVALRAWKWHSEFEAAKQKYWQSARLHLALWRVTRRLTELVCDRKHAEIAAVRRRRLIHLNYRQWEFLFLSRVIRRRKLLSLLHKKQTDAVFLPLNAWLRRVQSSKEASRKSIAISEQKQIRTLARAMMAFLQGMRSASRFKTAREISDLVFLGRKGLQIFRRWRVHAELQRRHEILRVLVKQRRLRNIFGCFVRNFRFSVAVNALLGEAERKRAEELLRRFLRGWRRYTEISARASAFISSRDHKPLQRACIREWKFQVARSTEEFHYSNIVASVSNFQLKKLSFLALISVTALQVVGRRLEAKLGNRLISKSLEKFREFAEEAAHAETRAQKELRLLSSRRVFTFWQSAILFRRVELREAFDRKRSVISSWLYLSQLPVVARNFRREPSRVQRVLENSFLVWTRRTRRRMELRHYLRNRTLKMANDVLRAWLVAFEKLRDRKLEVEKSFARSVLRSKHQVLHIWRAETKMSLSIKMRFFANLRRVAGFRRLVRKFKSSLRRLRPFFKIWLAAQVSQLIVRLDEKKADDFRKRRGLYPVLRKWRVSVGNEHKLRGNAEALHATLHPGRARKAFHIWTFQTARWSCLMHVLERVKPRLSPEEVLLTWHKNVVADEYRTLTIKTKLFLAWQRQALAAAVDRISEEAAERHNLLRLIRKTLLGFRKNMVVSRMKPLGRAKVRESFLLQGLLGLVKYSVTRRLAREMPRLALIFRRWRRLINLSIH